MDPSLLDSQHTQRWLKNPYATPTLLASFANKFVISPELQWFIARLDRRRIFKPTDERISNDRSTPLLYDKLNHCRQCASSFHKESYDNNTRKTSGEQLCWSREFISMFTCSNRTLDNSVASTIATARVIACQTSIGEHGSKKARRCVSNNDRKIWSDSYKMRRAHGRRSEIFSAEFIEN